MPVTTIAPALIHVASTVPTNPLLPTFKPSDGGVISCPQYNNLEHTLSDGSKWAIKCYTGFYDADITNLYTISADACVQTCERFENCQAAVWEPHSNNGRCYLKHDVGKESRNNTLIGFSKYPKLTTVIVPTSIPHTQQHTLTGAHITTVLKVTTSLPGSHTHTTTTAKGTIERPVTVKPTVIKPTTLKPTIVKPTTVKPTIIKPTTTKGTTAKGTTAKGTTAKGTTAKPATAKPTTAKGTTAKGTTAKGTTAKGTTAKGTTAKGTTAKPTTAKPTTAKPATAKPTTLSVVPKPHVGCGVLNHHGNTFHLRTHVAFGDPKFENLYVQAVHPSKGNEKVKNALQHRAAEAGGPPTIPILHHNRTTAAEVYYDSSTSSIAVWNGGCDFSGLSVHVDNDMNAWSSVFIADQVGTARMSIAWGDLRWLNDRFGSWLVCINAKTGRHELYWWDVITNMGIDTRVCAKVQLLTENL